MGTTCCSEQILEAAPHKTAFYFQSGHYWRSKDEFISDIFSCTPSHGHSSVGKPAKNLCSSAL